MKRSGFTLVEVSLFSALFGALAVTLFSVALTFESIRAQVSLHDEAESEGEFVFEKIGRFIDGSASIDAPASGEESDMLRLHLRGENGAEPAAVFLENSVLYLERAGERIRLSGNAPIRSFSVRHQSPQEDVSIIEVFILVSGETISQTYVWYR